MIYRQFKNNVNIKHLEEAALPALLLSAAVIFSFIFIIGTTPVDAQNRIFSQISVGPFQTGRNAETLAVLGIPLPLEEGGFQTFLNTGESIYLRVSTDYAGIKKRNIRTVRLSYKDELFQKTHYNHHLMITTYSLNSLATKEGIKLGSSGNEILVKYGQPHFIKSRKDQLEWIYINNRNNSREFFSFVLVKDKVTAIQCGVE